MPQIVETPCKGICRMDDEARLCSGCGRTLAEIAAWRTMTAAERRLIMRQLGRRTQGTAKVTAQ